MESEVKTFASRAIGSIGPTPIKLFLLFLLLLLPATTITLAQSLDLSQCKAPLGMESGEIPDSDLTASSSFEHGNVGPHIGRVRVEKQGGAWCPKSQVTSEGEEWIQIDLHTVHVITATETQGRFGNGQGQEFAEFYMISYWRPHLNKWVRYRDHSAKEILKGNINTYLGSKTELNPPIIASKIRILPYSQHKRTACVRVEIYGCPFRGGLLSYSMPQGSKKGDNWELYDQTYDGTWEGQYLSGGLGQLTDGRGGPINFKDDFYEDERGKGWVGWRNDSRNASDPLEIRFDFDSVREFNTVNIHVSNQFTREVQVFGEARVFFSVGGKLYSGDPIHQHTMEDCIFENPKNVTIKLHRRIGQYVKIQLFWATKWILISEITFDSQPAMGNFTEESVLPISATTTTTTTSRAPTTTGTPIQVNTNTNVNNGKGLKKVDEDGKEDFKGKRNEDPFKNHGQHQIDGSRAVVGNPVPIPINVPHSIVDQSPAAFEDFSSTTVVITAVISSLIAILLVLLMILTAFFLRHRLFLPGEKLSPKLAGQGTGGSSLHQLDYGGGVTFNSLLMNVTQQQEGDFEYASPGLIMPYAASSGDANSKSGSASFTPRDYLLPQYPQHLQQQPSFTSFVSSSGNISGNGNTSGEPSQKTFQASTTGGRSSKAEYYSCASVVPNPMVMLANEGTNNVYEYVLPKSTEFGLLPTVTGPGSQTQSRSCSPRKASSHSPQGKNRNRTIQLRFRELGLPEISKRRLQMIRKLGDGVFGTVYIGELEGSNNPSDRRLVAVKHLLRNATEKDKLDFLEEVRLLSSLSDPNVTQVLGVSFDEDPYSVILEFLQLGDLCQFLRQNDTLHLSSSKKLGLGGLVHLARQIASGMKFLECRSIVHRDLATRNCVVGRGLVVKISHFATDTDLYSVDYYRLDGKMPLPIRWMAWESLFLGKYSVKSDVWSFGVTLWEILTFCRQPPYPSLSDQEVIHNLRRLSILDETDPFELLDKPYGCPRDIYELMGDTLRRNDDGRPSFWEIHSFLTRKNLNYTYNNNTNTGRSNNGSSGTGGHSSGQSYNGGSGSGRLSKSSSYVEHYIV